MKNFLTLFSVLFLVSCGKIGKDGANGLDATTVGIKSVSTGIDFEDIGPGLACSNGGLSVFTFRDENDDGLFQHGEAVLKVKSLCHGENGSVDISSVASSDNCPAGGVQISSEGESSVEVCHGQAGAPGLAGEDGTLVKPVKFCTTDPSAFPEYGLIIGDDLFAVYWGTTPASKKPQAFLTKLVAGDYRSTGGNNCLFSVN